MTSEATANVLALDIGGANLKAADGGNYARAEFFPLWRTPEKLSEAIATLVAAAPPRSAWVVTMTGELADCFRTKRAGVAAIVDAVVVAAGPQVEVLIYLTDGTFVRPAEAKLRSLEAAASNWHATATLVARRFAPAAGLLIDIGSTTCDVVPFAAGVAAPLGRTDPDRLASGELIYTGVVRSPVCALVQTLPWRGKPCGVAQELFATTLDAYLMLGDLPEDPTNTNTADGRPATRELAHERLGRCVCADRESFDLADARAAAKAILDAQLGQLAAAWRRVVERSARPIELVVVAGQGEFLAQRLLRHVGWEGRTVSLAAEIGAAASQVAPAFALAQLADERRRS